MVGNIAKRYIESEALPEGDEGRLFSQHIKELDAPGELQPHIYARNIVDKNGQSPTNGHARQILNELRAYEQIGRSKDSTGYFIDKKYDDSWEYADSAQGARKYLGHRDDLIRFRRKVLRIFCYSLEALLSGTKDEEFLERAFQYIGYAIKASTRRAQHAKTGSEATSWLSSLVLAIMNTLWHSEGWKMDFTWSVSLVKKNKPRWPK
jgi:hypothetical protein